MLRLAPRTLKTVSLSRPHKLASLALLDKATVETSGAGVIGMLSCVLVVVYCSVCMAESTLLGGQVVQCQSGWLMSV